MSRSVGEWQQSVDQIMDRLRRNIVAIAGSVSAESRATAFGLFAIRHVEVDSELAGGFVFDAEAGRLKLGLSGLNLILAAGELRNFDGLTPDAFCEVAAALYLIHEWHHVSQGLAEFDDVQVLKRTAGANKLGELDVIADAVAAQIFACMQTAEEASGREFYAGSFLAAVRFMVRFCFPAFGFPESRRHKAQRALGIVLMAVATERAIGDGRFRDEFDAPLFPYLSADYTEVMILAFGGEPTQRVRLVRANLDVDAVRSMLVSIDSGNVEELLERARVFA